MNYCCTTLYILDGKNPDSESFICVKNDEFENSMAAKTPIPEVLMIAKIPDLHIITVVPWLHGTTLQKTNSRISTPNFPRISIGPWTGKYNRMEHVTSLTCYFNSFDKL